MSVVPAGVSRAVFRAALHVQKHSPTIMFVGGVTGVIGTTFLACKATLTLSEELDEMKKRIEMAVEAAEASTREEGRKEIAFAYGTNAARVIQLYAPAAALGSLSIGLLTGSHVVLTRRNAGLTAGYAILEKTLDQYRERVREDQGAERELELYRGVTKEVVKDPETGKKSTVVATNPLGGSMYARWFDESNPNWEGAPNQNLYFLRCQEQWANDQLLSRGHLFLNEVYRQLGMDHDKAGAVVGWVLTKDREHNDNFIDFGLYAAGNEAFVNGRERNVKLDFNVDGMILDKI